MGEAKALTPHAYQVTVTRALIQEACGNHDGARQLFEDALAVNPLNADNTYHLARVYFRLGLHRLAVTCMSNAIRIDPYNEQYWAFFGQILDMLHGGGKDRAGKTGLTGARGGESGESSDADEDSGDSTGPPWAPDPPTPPQMPTWKKPSWTATWRWTAITSLVPWKILSEAVRKCQKSRKRLPSVTPLPWPYTTQAQSRPSVPFTLHTIR